ncbi:hypothetical protein E4T43_03113 [Aureobasidium subglaciale]|nr:hypothetical protein E4T43_03113 [Aureobasidium subglaciale]
MRHKASDRLSFTKRIDAYPATRVTSEQSFLPTFHFNCIFQNIETSPKGNKYATNQHSSKPTQPTMSSSTTTKTTKSDHEQPAFPTSANNLSNLLKYTSHASGHGLISLVSLPPNSLFSPITAFTPHPHAEWHTLQVSATSHISLDSAYTYLNHSCAPSLEIDTEKMQVRVARDRELKVGDALSFFYPSTEWEMDRGFECLCGEEGCVGQVKGAKDMSKEELNKWFINGYIWSLVEERDAKA